MLVIDESQPAMRSRDHSGGPQPAAWLGNELQYRWSRSARPRPGAIQSDDQLANRFTPFGLPPWEGGLILAGL